jgi:hypothetical protein
MKSRKKPNLLSRLPIIKFDQFWKDVEWVSRQNFSEDKALDKQYSNIKAPNKLICNLLSKMYETFYPTEIHKSVKEAKDYVEKNKKSLDSNIDSLIRDYFPWVIHQALSELKDKGKISEKKYENTLKSFLKKEWIQSWHWRAVMTVLIDLSKNINEEGYTNIIQISHIRKWEMLLCYSVENKYLNEINKLSEIDLKHKILLRAPLFGIGHRLRSWDSYRLFYQKHIKKYVEDKMKKYKYDQNNADLPCILGRHDCYYIVNDVRRIKNGFTWSLKTFLDIEPEKILIDKDIFCNSKDAYYFKPSDLIDIPSFGHHHEGISQLLSSDHYCQAIYELTEVHNDPTAKSVLLIAPPGSGKEKLAQSAFYCRDPKESRGKFISTTLAGLNAIEASKLLFSCKNEIVDLKIPDSLEDHPKNGLIIRALDGALFIDEIDKTDESIRNLLLRLLESGEITVPDSSKILHIPKNRRPLYIFAASMNRNLILKESPPDFWTRISHIIEIEHPLGIDELDSAKKVIKNYLWMFWCLHVKDFMQKKVTNEEKAKNDLAKPLNDFYLNLYKFLLNEVTLNFATDILADEISGRGKPLVSVRTLRSVVARSIFKFVDVLLYSKVDSDPIENYKLKKKQIFHTYNSNKWFDQLKIIIECENKRKFAKEKKINALEYSVIENLKSAIRSGTTLVTINI